MANFTVRRKVARAHFVLHRDACNHSRVRVRVRVRVIARVKAIDHGILCGGFEFTDAHKALCGWLWLKLGLGFIQRKKHARDNSEFRIRFNSGLGLGKALIEA